MEGFAIIIEKQTSIVRRYSLFLISSSRSATLPAFLMMAMSLSSAESTATPTHKQSYSLRAIQRGYFFFITCGVIASVFQPLESVDQELQDLCPLLGGEVVQVSEDSCEQGQRSTGKVKNMH